MVSEPVLTRENPTAHNVAPRYPLEKHLRVWLFECIQPSPQAYKLGLGAVALLILAHLLPNFLGGSVFVVPKMVQKHPLTGNWLLLALFFTWIILVFGLAMLVIGTLSNKKSRVSCGFSHHHFLSIGGILCIVHGLFSVAYYVTATTLN